MSRGGTFGPDQFITMVYTLRGPVRSWEGYRCDDRSGRPEHSARRRPAPYSRQPGRGRGGPARPLVARSQLPDHRADLPEVEPVAARAALRRPHQTAPARALGHQPRAVVDL